MCRMLNNFAELAVRVLERHIKLHSRLTHARQTLAKLGTSNTTTPPKVLEPPALPEAPHKHTKGPSSSRPTSKKSTGSVENKNSNEALAAPGEWSGSKGSSQSKEGGSRGAEAAAVSAACKRFGGWWGDSFDSVSALTAAAGAAAQGKGEESGKGGEGQQLQAVRQDLQLCRVFEEREVRDTGSTQDACVLLVDTGHPSWPVVYADETWEQWAGEWEGCVF